MESAAKPRPAAMTIAVAIDMVLELVEKVALNCRVLGFM
jgi:hypothetical protein